MTSSATLRQNRMTSSLDQERRRFPDDGGEGFGGEGFARFAGSGTSTDPSSASPVASRFPCSDEGPTAIDSSHRLSISSRAACSVESSMGLTVSRCKGAIRKGFTRCLVIVHTSLART
jgi:hypothetical protein